MTWAHIRKARRGQALQERARRDRHTQAPCQSRGLRILPQNGRNYREKLNRRVRLPGIKTPGVRNPGIANEIDALPLRSACPIGVAIRIRCRGSRPIAIRVGVFTLDHLAVDLVLGVIIDVVVHDVESIVEYFEIFVVVLVLVPEHATSGRDLQRLFGTTARLVALVAAPALSALLSNGVGTERPGAVANALAAGLRRGIEATPSRRAPHRSRTVSSLSWTGRTIAAESTW